MFLKLIFTGRGLRHLGVGSAGGEVGLLGQSAPLGLLYGLVFVLGTVGNGLVIFVVRRYKRMRNATNLFLASLSTADLLLIW